MAFNQRLCGLVALACVFAASGCGGDGGEEAVFLYFINAYPGASKLSVISERGTLASNIPFGERYGATGSCGPESTGCGPVRVDRAFGAEWTIMMESMPEPAELTKELFSMYPQETGTLVLTQRSGESDVQSTLFRHVQSIEDDCRISFFNGLAGNNSYLGDEGLGAANYSLTHEFYHPTPEEIAAAAQISTTEAESPFISECGPLPTNDPIHDSLQRPQTLARILADPWFFYDCAGTADMPGVCIARWGDRQPGRRARVSTKGQFSGYPSSAEYYACVQGAISIRPDEGGIALPFPGIDNPCPPSPLTWDDVDIDWQAVDQCRGLVQYNSQMLEPGQSDSYFALAGQGDSLLCDIRFRVRAGGADIIFGPAGENELGQHGNGAPVETVVDIPAGSERFWVMFGRPVNPLIWQWDSSLTFVDLANFPYFNQGGDRPDIGDTDL